VIIPFALKGTIVKSRLLWCLALIAGCGRREQVVQSRPINTAEKVMISDDEIRKSIAWSRFPDEAIGHWIPAAEAASLVKLSHVQFHSTLPFPAKGYVPLGSTGPTVSAGIHNHSGQFLADVELIVTATDRQTGTQLAQIKTETMTPYQLTPPDSNDGREVLLGEIFDRNGSPFVDADEWPAFTIHAEIHRIRLIDEEELLDYCRKREVDARKSRAAQQGGHDP
jgi:hypothetical protein